MKSALFLIANLFMISQAHSMASIKGFFTQDQSPTEAGVCIDCVNQPPFQGQPLTAIDRSQAASEGGSIIEAQAHFELFIKKNPECMNNPGKSYGMITDLSNGTASNLTYIISIDTVTGKTTREDIFQTGEGSGVGNNFENVSNLNADSTVSNGCGSLAAPHGFMKMGASDYRPPSDRTNPLTGDIFRSDWPVCGALNPNFSHNRIMLDGLEKGYNDNLSEKNVRDNPSNPILCRNSKGIAQPRYARLHSIGYQPGPTTQGCKGMPLNKWCKWAPLLKGGCIYNYDGSESPAIKRIKGTASSYLGS